MRLFTISCPICFPLRFRALTAGVSGSKRVAGTAAGVAVWYAAGQIAAV